MLSGVNSNSQMALHVSEAAFQGQQDIIIYL